MEDTDPQQHPHGEARPWDDSFEALVRRLRAGTLETRQPDAAPLRAGDVEPWPGPSTERHARFAALGEEALRRGRVASAVVAGGAGTRFGGAVKALVPVLGGRTFLDLKLEDARRAAMGRAVPLAIMTSPLTHGAILERVRSEPDVLVFAQRMLPRLTAELEPALEPDGTPSLAPAGHGDFFRALREGGAGAVLAARGVRVLYFSNVDNLAATLDAVVIGAHLALGGAVTVEVTARRGPSGKLDAGAAPVRVGDRVQLVEQVDPERHPLISTNNIAFDLRAILAREVPLPWRVARKEVGGRPVLQLEQVTGEITALAGPDGRAGFPSRFLEVPRDDPATTRFEPVKEREDLPRVADRLRARFGH
ncbi:MAG TPA: UTP--glucose-1-phosphate uridylyltransferase [Anaeromyxobacter sp.]|nr:UTP--glucose-1-phosphate uridylyltransferase [Anaeromyxobacter sp.]